MICSFQNYAFMLGLKMKHVVGDICQYCANQIRNIMLSGYNSKRGTMDFLTKGDRKSDQPDFIGYYFNALYLNAGLISRDRCNEVAIATRRDKMLKDMWFVLSLRENK